MAETISKKINKMFQKLFETKDNNHPFFKDLKRVYEESSKRRRFDKNEIKSKINHKIIDILPNELNINQKYDILNMKDLKELVSNV